VGAADVGPIRRSCCQYHNTKVSPVLQYQSSIALILPLFGAEIEPIYTAYHMETEGIECLECHFNHISELELSIPPSDFIYVLSFFNYKSHPSLIITNTPFSTITNPQQ
jgi:hypothetical protein